MAAIPRYIEFDGKWQNSQQGEFKFWQDMRNLAVIYHPFSGSTTGDFGMISRRVTIPVGGKGPYSLSFYCTDDYTSDETTNPTNDYNGHDIYPHHRFKQVLVNGQVVWESDVADVDDYGNRPLISVDLTPYVQPGTAFELSLRVYEKVGMDTRLPSDFYLESGYTSGKSAPEVRDLPYPRAFRTYVYWGDVCIADAAGEKAVTVPRPRPSTLAALKLHNKSWPLPPFGEKLPNRVDLDLESLAPIPASGFPATCGVPIPAGKLTDAGAVTLRNGDGKVVPLQTEVLNRWQDGSIRWLLLNFEATRAAKRNARWAFELKAPKAPAKPVEAVTVRRSGDTVRVSTGAITVLLGKDHGALIDTVHVAGRTQPVASGIRAQMRASVTGEAVPISATVEEISITERGPMRATIEERGTLAGGGLTVGRFVFRIHAYAGKPYVRTFFRVFNDTGSDLRVQQYGLVMPLGLEGKRQVAWGKASNQRITLERGSVAVMQENLTTATLITPTVTVEGQALAAAGEKTEGWISASNSAAGAVVAVRDFWQLYPKALRATLNGLEVDLHAATADIPFYAPHDGEAKRHEILLGFYGGRITASEASALNAGFQSPPRLMDPEWFCKSGGFGPARWHDKTAFPELTKYMQETYKDVRPEDIGGGASYGARNFGDAPYGQAGPKGQWRNNYYDCQGGLLAEYLMTGDRRWFDRFEESCEHYQDVDICHHCAATPDYVGLVHTLGEDHSIWGAPWAAFERGTGLCYNWRMTGDPDSREEFFNLAEAIIRTGQGAGVQYSRNWAGPMTTLVRAYEETWDKKWLEQCRKSVEVQYTQILDPRRGVYMDTHGNYNYRGMVPWMDVQVCDPLFLYYRLTGDFRAADAAIAIAECLITEAMTPDADHKMLGYSTNPHFGPTEGYNVLIAPAIMQAYDLTGDTRFLAVGRVLYDRTIKERSVNHILNCYWKTPALLYYLEKYGDLKATPAWE